MFKSHGLGKNDKCECISKYIFLIRTFLKEFGNGVGMFVDTGGCWPSSGQPWPSDAGGVDRLQSGSLPPLLGKAQARCPSCCSEVDNLTKNPTRERVT